MTDDAQTTKTRLLDAAEELFARKDFDEVSIRELATAADVNVAAVNYHFQGKENLHREVIVRRFAAQRDRSLAALDELMNRTGPPPTLQEVIAVVVGQYLQGSLGTDAGPSFLLAVSREMHDAQQHTHTALFREMIFPIFGAFSAAVARTRPHLREEQISWAIATVIAQVHHFIIRWIKKEAMVASNDETAAMMVTVFPVLGEDLQEYIRQVTRHICEFSAAALDGLYPEVTP